MNFIALNPKTLFYILPFIGGLLYSLGFPIINLPHSMVLSFIGIFLLFISLSLPYPKEGHEENIYQRPLKKKILTALIFCLGHVLSGYYWIPYTLKEFGYIPFPLNFMLGSLFSLIIMPQLLSFIVILHYWEKFRLKKTLFAGGIYTRNIIFAGLFTLLEQIIPQQFPAHLGHTWLQLSPYIGFASIGGVAIFSFMSYWFVLSFTSLWHGHKIDKLGVGAFIVFVMANLFTPLEWKPNQKESTRIRMVQANIGNFMKVSSESGDAKSIKEIHETYVNHSTAESENPIDLTIWPETAYPSLLNSAIMRINTGSVPFIVRKSAIESNSQVFFGGYDRSDDENSEYYETEYNSAFLISREGEFEEVYHKRKLIPFGEALPFGPFNPYLAKVITNISYFARGDKSVLFSLDNGKKFISAICYEILFTGFIKTYLEEVKESPHFIVNLTNDSWYGRTSEPYQHQFLSHWRALEFHLPIVRMTNTGITSILYPDGSESKRLEIFKEDHLDLDLYTQEHDPTFYQRHGVLFNILIVLFFFIVAIAFEKIKVTKD